MDLVVIIDEKNWLRAGYGEDIQKTIHKYIEEEIEKCRQSFQDVCELKEIMIEVRTSRANSFLGQMMMKSGQKKGRLSGIMKISESVLKAADEKELRDIIMHEILHLLPGGRGHLGMWRKRADYINKRYGYNLERCGKSHEWIGKREQNKFLLTCCSCGQKYYYKRKSRNVRYYKLVRCGNCGGDLILTLLD